MKRNSSQKTKVHVFSRDFNGKETKALLQNVHLATTPEMKQLSEVFCLVFGLSTLVPECQQEENQNYYIKACRVDSHNH